MKYKVGDKVRVIRNPKGEINYCMENDPAHSNVMTKEMRELAGEVVTITTAGERGYNIADDCGAWHWTDEMFDGLVLDAEPEPQPKPDDRPKFRCGDRLRVRTNLKAGKSYLCENGTSLDHPSSWHCNTDMANRAGSVMTVSSVERKEGYIFYKMVEDSREWCWPADMFDGLAAEEPPTPAPALHTDWSWEDLF